MNAAELLARLDAIGASLEETGEALALLGVGSVGVELERLDAYSDLDFFVIAKPGFKARFIDRLDWLESISPVAFAFQNTPDGSKIMFADGIYGEFAVFEEDELSGIPYAPGRIVWIDPECSPDRIDPSGGRTPQPRGTSPEYALNEAVTNLYVVLCRYARGERLSSVRFIEQHALEQVVSVLHLYEQEVPYYPDSFRNERRIERRFPEFSSRLNSMLQGYENIPQSALAILNYIEGIYPVNAKMAASIRSLAAELGAISSGQ